MYHNENLPIVSLPIETIYKKDSMFVQTTLVTGMITEYYLEPKRS